MTPQDFSDVASARAAFNDFQDSVPADEVPAADPAVDFPSAWDLTVDPDAFNHFAGTYADTDDGSTDDEDTTQEAR